MSRRRASRAGTWIGSLVVCMLLAACSGVPSSSSPQVVTPINVERSGPATTIAPQPGDSQQAIVQGFLNASMQDDAHHAQARGFLTADERNKWNDATVTVLDAPVSAPVVGSRDSVTVSGSVVGTLNANCSYSPTLTGTGAGTPSTFQFGTTRVGGQWRISTLRNGIVLDQNTFAQLYREHDLYFYDASNTIPVVIPCYSAISDPEDLAKMLIGQLADLGQGDLQTALSTDLPTQDTALPDVTDANGQVTINLPGADQLGAHTRNNLAVQLAETLSSVYPPDTEYVITGAGGPITVPLAQSTRFTAYTVAASLATVSENPPLYYLRDGHLVNDHGAAVAGPLGQGEYQLESIAATVVSNGLRVAATVGSGRAAQLWAGTASQAMRRVALTGQLSRPSFAPAGNEIWIGNGNQLVRVPFGGAPSPVALVSASGGSPPPGTVAAVRVSPDGSRIAMVLTSANESGPASGQLWTGIIVRSGGKVSVEALQAITPRGLSVQDVAWLPATKLFFIASGAAASQQAATQVYEVQVDGALLTQRESQGLPSSGPDSITIASGSVAWVSANNTVFKQRNDTWVSPGGPTGDSIGSNPVYAE